MKSLLIIAQKVDEGDDLLGFFVDWIKEFTLYANVDVVALKTPTRKLKVVRWVVLMVQLIWKIPQCDMVFVHMSPLFAVIAGPWAWLWRKPIYLWYLHRSLTLKLKIAAAFSKKIFTASVQSLTFKSNKITAVGHGVNVEKYKTQRTWTNSAMRILSVGRISPIKDYETLLEATKGLDVTIVGRTVMSYDDAYFEKLKKMGGARFVGFVSHQNMPSYYANADVVINGSPTGGIDKVVLEAMAAGCLVLVANHAFIPYLLDDRLWYEHGNAEDLATKIKTLMALSPDEKTHISNMLVASVREHHSLKSTIARMVKIMNL